MRILVIPLKKFLKAKVHPLVWERLGQAKQEFYWNKMESHYDDGLKDIFEEYLSFENGFYVDLGSNDGRSSSNTYHLEKSLGWSGILVEPILHIHFRSREIRSTATNHFFCCALVGGDYDREIVELSYSGLMTVATAGVSRFEADEWARKGCEFLSRGETVTKTWSAARTLQSILEEAQAPKTIDFISVDIEGSEWSVLQDFIFDKWFIKFIMIEADLGDVVHGLLIRNGFVLQGQVNQNLFFQNSKLLE